MKRFKPTPEVIVKSLVAFFFGMIVGFISFRLVTKFSPNFASATTISEPTPEASKSSPEPFEKTSFPLPLDSPSEKSNLENNTNVVNVILKNYPNIEVDEEEEETDA